MLARKAFPNLQADAREQLTLTSYLAQIDSTQVRFSVKQTHPKTLDEAVAATLEMESYLLRTSRIGQVNLDREETTTCTSAVAGVQSSMQETMMEMLARLQKLETGNGPLSHQGDGNQLPTRGPEKNYRYSKPQNDNPRYTMVCLKRTLCKGVCNP